MSDQLEEVIGPDCMDCAHSFDAHLWAGGDLIGACDACSCTGYRYEVRKKVEGVDDE